MSLDEGTISLKILPPDEQLLADDQDHLLGTQDYSETLGVAVLKKADRTLEIRIAFEHWGHSFFGPIPPFPPEGLSLAVSWDSKSINLWVQGERVASAPFKPSVH